ncbi:MAG: TIGR01244 family phosphatase [Silicimonas sp.]|nr:TIGR01244 family phosphatase [Silicimonas sp.]NND17333.1 TIGR01244 family phosphatase [Silicimonas sp.]NNL35737.1 TIGR01244 family phosphatase [Silicimonas sp.]NNL71772.1 TIGR01244 family phosphatase [Silicimonas sp.]
MSPARYLTDTFAVAPQISTEDLAGLKAEGFRTIVCNRPDEEVPGEMDAAAIEAACRDLELGFLLNPLSHGSLSMDHVTRQREAAGMDGPVLAYCASGNRSSILWGLAMAGELPTDEIISRTTAAGYNLTGLVPQLEALAAERTG